MYKVNIVSVSECEEDYSETDYVRLTIVDEGLEFHVKLTVLGKIVSTRIEQMVGTGSTLLRVSVGCAEQMLQSYRENWELEKDEVVEFDCTVDVSELDDFRETLEDEVEHLANLVRLFKLGNLTEQMYVDKQEALELKEMWDNH